MAMTVPPGVSSLTVQQQKISPNQSIYIQNLPEKLQKEDLRRELYILFSTYGSVLDVTALKNKKMRGQAHVLFKDVQGATQALRNCQGFEFFGREMKISYSKNRSNTLAKLTGTFNQPQTNGQPAQIAQPPSSFPAPPGMGGGPPSGLPPPPSALPKPPSALPPPPGLPAAPVAVNGKSATAKAVSQEPTDVASPQGVKRRRDESDDEEDEEDNDVAMEEDDDEGEMEMSDDDD